jgi:hypothetical protein
MAENRDTPQFPGCQCGAILQVYFQPGLTADCAMEGMTLSANDYPREPQYLFSPQSDRWVTRLIAPMPLSAIPVLESLKTQTWKTS